MELNYQTDFEYIPHWNNNKEEALPIKIYWRLPTYKQRKQISYHSMPTITNEHMRMTSAELAENIEIKIVVDREKAVILCVKLIENLTVCNKKIESGADLVNTPGLGDLVDEIGTIITGRMNEVSENSKNSEQPST